MLIKPTKLITDFSVEGAGEDLVLIKPSTVVADAP